MPAFAAPAPLAIAVDVPHASLHVIASEREDAVVTVLPADPSRSGSVRAAEEIQVEQRGDALTLSYPGSWKQYLLPFAAGTASITLEVPAGSSVRGRSGTLLAEGALATVDMALTSGDVRLERVEQLDLKVSAGSAVVDRVGGRLTLSVGAGSVRIREIEGEGSIRAANGTTTVDSLTGSLEITGAHGDIAVGRMHGDLVAKSAHAGIRVDRLDAGRATLTTSFGALEAGIPEGTAAYLDLSTENGTVRNLLTPAEGPVDDEPTAQIQASTRYGDIIVRRP
ncbi:DUF4097 family beta strand repeat-containing protein [Brachybacterium sp. YJGR34]|uniref:DUF4097 family beta strand repeat-containing protein n=1 Tax=Brachybacterium sp. YJGR34 TaxID=2059911 RepID=UPI000E0CA1E1|nr:DUF4097 family beta strand repeat-containing protein [Brachybacterium sp. YJGR34]